jgi:hypothetical protein
LKLQNQNFQRGMPMPPAGDFIRIQVDLTGMELRNYTILWSGTEYRVATVIFGNRLAPTSRDIARGTDIAEGVSLFSGRLLEYLAKRHDEIAEEVEYAKAMAANPRPGFRPITLAKQARAHANRFEAWKRNTKAKIAEALQDAASREWPVVSLTMPWDAAPVPA